jgi:protein-S-isoprenylcysteine O-methyltransferase Ste14
MVFTAGARDFVRRRRVRLTQAAALLIFVVLLLGTSAWPKDGLADVLFETIGVLLLGVGAFGRLWASMHIAGYKTKQLITDGPYSMVRNPLYLFSFIGAVGAGFVTESLLIVCLIVLSFALFYPIVVVEEENKLAARHGEDYAAYKRRTPRFIPNPMLFSEAETYVVNARVYRRALLDATLFIAAFCPLHLLEQLHETGALPHFFRIY